MGADGDPPDPPKAHGRTVIHTGAEGRTHLNLGSSLSLPWNILNFFTFSGTKGK